LGLFEQAEQLVSDASEKEHLKACILQAREHLRQLHNSSESTSSTSNGGPKIIPFFIHFDCDIAYQNNDFKPKCRKCIVWDGVFKKIAI
jgi:hypothetical protein